MRKKPFGNPVLHFGSGVAKDLTVEESCCNHFRKAFKSLTDWRKEIDAGMRKAMLANTAVSEVRTWLVFGDIGHKHAPAIGGLLVRYCRIQDAAWRREEFLKDGKTFWEASKPLSPEKPTAQKYRDILHVLTNFCKRHDISIETVCQDLAELFHKYDTDRGK
jgi:hypothetical protein